MISNSNERPVMKIAAIAAGVLLATATLFGADAKIPADYKGTPASGKPVELPGVIRLAEHDKGEGTLGGARVAGFGKGHVTIENKPEDASQKYLGWTGKGNFVKVTVHVKEAGTYVIGGHFAAANNKGKLSFSFNDITTGPVAIPTTDGKVPGVEVYHVWQQCENLAEVKLEAGDYVFTCKIEESGGFNLESVTVKKKP
jgi:hypothetical protein